MTTFDKREEGFEKKFAHDEELRFKANARRNRMLGMWAAEKLGLTGDAAAVYAKEVVMSDFEEGGEHDVAKKVHKDLEAKGALLERGLLGAAKEAGVRVTVNRQGSMITPFFVEGPVRSWDDAAKADTKKFGRFFRVLLERSVLVPPSQFEAWFISLAHTTHDLERAIEAASLAMKA